MAIRLKGKANSSGMIHPNKTRRYHLQSFMFCLSSATSPLLLCKEPGGKLSRAPGEPASPCPEDAGIFPQPVWEWKA